jgi:hypothetical protein
MDEMRMKIAGEGAAAGARSQLGRSWKQVDRINRALQDWKVSAMPPRASLALNWGMVAGSVMLGAAFLSSHYGTGPQNWLAVGSVVLGVGGAANLWVRAVSRVPLTHVDHIDSLLAAYEPVLKEAYRRLQKSVEEKGALRVQAVSVWVHEECAAIQRAGGWHLPTEGQFLKKWV